MPNCRAEILPRAHACIQCGKPIPERANNEQIHVGMGLVPPGYNHLSLHETADVRDLDVMITNEAIVHIGDFLPSLLETRTKRYNGSSVNQQPQNQTDLVEVASEVPLLQPQLPAGSTQSPATQGGIWELFRNYDGRLTQEKLDLKATNKKDYIIRLAYLYLFARYHLKDEPIPREDVFKILDEARVKDTHRYTYINESGIRSDENETYRLTVDGRTRAQQYLSEVLDPQLPEGWTPIGESHAAGPRPKKPAKKSTEPRSNIDTLIAGWISHDVTKTLSATIPHGTIENLSALDKSLLALYGIYRAGTEHEVQVASIANYLYGAFQVQLKTSLISATLHSARKWKTAKTYINFVNGQGYKITPSGREHIEDVLKLKQPQTTTTDGTSGSNGAAQK
jgi:hypothetical protein